VEPGSILAVTGASGSGKTTLLRMLARLTKPDSGEIIYRGNTCYSIPPAEWRRRVHYVSQKPIVFDGTLEENFRLPFTINAVKSKKDFSLQTARQYMQELQLPLNTLDQEARTMSGGEIARVALIRALLIEPEVLLLDEPTAYLDPESAISVLRLLNKWVKGDSERAVIIVSHKKEDLNYLEDVSILSLDDKKEKAN